MIREGEDFSDGSMTTTPTGYPEAMHGRGKKIGPADTFGLVHPMIEMKRTRSVTHALFPVSVKCSDE
jgi:hypothetical protein